MAGADFKDLFATTAETSAALTGLLFVAASIVPRRALFAGAPVIQQVRAAAALLAFVNALTVSLFSLVPGTDVGWPAAIVGVGGLLFTAAALRSTLSSVPGRSQRLRQLGLVVLLLLIFGVEVAAGIAVIRNPADSSAMEWIGYALVSMIIAGVARAWELVGERDTGILASLAILAGHESPLGQTAGQTADGSAGETADVADGPAASDAGQAGERQAGKGEPPARSGP